MTDPKQPRSQINVLISSAISCVVTMTAINPLQVAKLKYQYAPVLCPQYPHPSFKELNNCDCTKFNIADSFKGLPLSLFQGLVGNTMYMQFYQYQRQYLINHLPSSLATLTSALSSRLMVTTIMVPIQAFRVRLTNSTQKLQITNSKSGLKATLTRDLTYSCLYWLTIEQIRNFMMGAEYRTQKQNSNNMLYMNVLPAAVGGSLISFLTTPLDAIKTRTQSGIQLQGSMLRQMQGIYRKQGFIGLFSGVKQRVLRNTINSVIYLSLFQYIMDKLEERGKGKGKGKGSL